MRRFDKLWCVFHRWRASAFYREWVIEREMELDPLRTRTERRESNWRIDRLAEGFNHHMGRLAAHGGDTTGFRLQRRIML